MLWNLITFNSFLNLDTQIGYKTRTLEEVGTTSNIEVHPARVLSHLYTFLGRHSDPKLGIKFGNCWRIQVV
jgi:hypothetical protein